MEDRAEAFARESIMPSLHRLSVSWLGNLVNIICQEIQSRGLMSYADRNIVATIMLSAKAEANKKGQN